MFTGIIEEIGVIDRISRGSVSAKLRIRCRRVLEGTQVGDSIAVNGVCLTATRVDKDAFEADVMEETVSRSSLASLQSGSPVNLERAMPAMGRFGGHVVAGHVDGVGRIASVEKKEMAVVYEIGVGSGGASSAGSTAGLMRYIVEKGSIAIDGISLTVASVSETGFTVSVIPHTIAQTNLKNKSVGDTVNLETDIIGKYVEKMMESGDTPDGSPAFGGSGNSGAAGSPGEGELSGDFDKARAFLVKNGF
ncbi:MAG: riboflavin synthase [Eubacterium sp.]|nr:riboflavin synthase [Eubacterium sp.]